MAVLAVQRFVVMSDLPVSKSDEHESIGEQLSWAMGSFGLAPMLGVSSSGPGKSERASRPGRQLARARRQLLECTPPAPPPSDTPLSLPPALPPATPPDQCDSGTLNDRLLTLGVVLAVVLVLQLGAHILWKRILNGRYYLHLPLNCANVDGDGKLSRGEQRKALSPPPSPPDESGAAQPNSPQGGARCRALASTRSKGSLTNLVRSSKALLRKKNRPQGLRSGKLAPVPAGAPPLSKVSTAKFLLNRRRPSCKALASTSSPADEPAAAADATAAAAAAAGGVAAAAAAPPPRSLASTRSKGSLTNLVRSSKALLAKKNRPQVLEGYAGALKTAKQEGSAAASPARGSAASPAKAASPPKARRRLATLTL